MTDKLKNLLQDKKIQQLISNNDWNSWRELYKEILPTNLKGEFTQIILNSKINDPAEILTYIPDEYLKGQDIKEYEIPENVTIIGARAFNKCFRLTNIKMSNKVNYLFGYAFADCHNLIDINLSNSLGSIGEYAFWSCSSLINMEMPNSVNYLYRGAFSNCSNLKNVKLSTEISSIPPLTFSNDISLNNIIIPDSVKTIWWSAFNNCKSLTQIEIPGKIKIMNDAFEECFSLKEIKYRGTKENFSKIVQDWDREWGRNSSISKIICNDGEVSL